MNEQYFITLSNKCTHAYQLKFSNRAKRLSLKMSLSGDLFVVIPVGMDEALAHSFVRQEAGWVERQLNKKQFPLKSSIFSKPKVLKLKMLNEQWQVKYISEASNRIEYDEQPDQCLQISGAVESDELVQKIIGLFLKNKAAKIFPNRVAEIAKLHHFNFSHVKIRGQKARWGSCSNRKILNLNYKLLFMPENVANYVFIHELCHTIEMNHSVKFWQLVEKCDPNYKDHEKYLKENGHIIRYY